jgi:hypothetical protein
MAEVITFVNYQPPRRYDTLPWTAARIYEATTEGGTETLIDTITLSPVDTDPAVPAARNFTTENGTAPELWYRIVFVDGTGDTSTPTEAIQNVPSAAAPAVQAYATVDELFRLLEIRTPTAAQTDAGHRVLDAAALEIDSYIGRASPYPDPPALVVEVNLERAIEHWSQSYAPYGVFQASGVPILTARDSFRRHAHKLLPLKESFGVA